MHYNLFSMQTNFYFKNFTDELKQTIQEYSQKHIKKVEKLCGKNDKESSILNINCEYHKKHNAFTTHILIDMPYTAVHASKDSHDPKKALDIIFQKLILQIKKQKEKIRKI